MKLEQQVNEVRELANSLGDLLDGQSMSVVMPVLSRLYAQCAIDMGMTKEDFVDVNSAIYEVLSDMSDEAVH
jgi:vacuolar-type H+-ATPase subunit B/Vma2